MTSLEDHHEYLLKRLMLSLGLLAIGAALAWTLALALLQDAAIAAGALPQPGQKITPEILRANPLWQAARTLQRLANTVGVLGTVLLITYAVAERRGMGFADDAETTSLEADT